MTRTWTWTRAKALVRGRAKESKRAITRAKTKARVGGITRAKTRARAKARVGGIARARARANRTRWYENQKLFGLIITKPFFLLNSMYSKSVSKIN